MDKMHSIKLEFVPANLTVTNLFGLVFGSGRKSDDVLVYTSQDSVRVYTHGDLDDIVDFKAENIRYWHGETKYSYSRTSKYIYADDMHNFFNELVNSDLFHDRFYFEDIYMFHADNLPTS